MTLVFKEEQNNKSESALKAPSIFATSTSTNAPNLESKFLDWLLALFKSQHLESVPYHYACFIHSHLMQVYPKATQGDLVLLTVTGAALMTGINQQNVCVNLVDIQNFIEDLALKGGSAPIEIPAYEQWPDILLSLPSVVAPSEETEDSLWVLDQQNLYLRRYWQYENVVVNRVLDSAVSEQTTPTTKTAAYVDSLFPKQNMDVDWQRIAVQQALGRRFYVISGGPGTGKTTTVVKLLLAIIEQYASQGKKPKIKLAAPTGKASARLSESLRNSLSNMSTNGNHDVPTDAETLHRLLKRLPNGEFFYNENKRLPVDVVVVDEASMVDLSMMAKLINGLAPDCQLILLGDKNQLSSVEAGSVLAEISEAQEDLNINVVTELQKSYRFDGKGEIGLFASAVKQGKPSSVLKLVEAAQNGQGQVDFWQEHQGGLEKAVRCATQHYQALYGLLKDLSLENEQARIHQAFKQMSELQVLACTKMTAQGVDEFNQALTKNIKQRNQLSHWQLHYCSRPIMVTENAYSLNLFNGDMGIEAVDPATGQMVAYFPELSDLGYRKIACQRLPQHDSVYAMTVHKSQGSEFVHTILLLPQQSSGSKMITRELLYTGLTRAKQKFTLVGTAELVRMAVSNQSARRSGIKAKLSERLGQNQ